MSKRSNLCVGMVCYPTYGGSGIVATELSLALASRGCEVHVISSDRPRRLSFHENVFFHGVSMSLYPLFRHAPYESALASKIVEVCLRYPLDLLHVHYAIPHASAGYVAREILKQHGVRLPLMTTLHGTDITLVGRDNSYASVVSFAIQSSDAVTAVSEFLKRETQAHFGTTKDILVIPNFVDMSRFTKQLKQESLNIRKQFCGCEDTHLLAHVSNFRKVKNVPQVLRVFAEVCKQPVKACLVLLGEGPERPAAQRMVKALGLEKQVHFLGAVEQVETLLPAVDVLLMPSTMESFGLAALEAMSCGVPVVASDQGGLPSLIRHGKDGFLCPVDDVDTMSKGVLTLLKDKTGTFGRHARERAKEFDLSKVLPKYEEQYLRLARPLGVS